MLADPTGEMCKAFGTYIEDKGLSLRGTFIIDPDGEVCPANWEPGEKTLVPGLELVGKI